MKYAFEMVSGGVTYVSSFIKICSGVQKLFEVGYTHRKTQTAR
jgi:hypothetical protein